MAAPSSYEGWAHAVKPTIESRLADAEAELAFLRADNGRVARENARLRGQCERLSAEMAMLSEDPEAQARQLRRGLMGARRRDGSDVDLASTADAAARDRPPRASSREDRQLSLFLTDGKGALTERKVPGIVSAPPGVLQFGVVQAEVASTGFVGLRPLGTDDAVNTAPTSTSSVSTKLKSLMKGVLAGGTAVAFGADGARDEPEATPDPADASTRSSYEIVWKEGGDGDKDTAGGTLRRLAFECDANAFEYVREQIRSWSASAMAGSTLNPNPKHRRAGSNLTIDLHDGNAGAEDSGDEGGEGEVGKTAATERKGDDKVAEAPERAEDAPEGDGGGRSGEKGSTTPPPHKHKRQNGEFFPVVDGADADMSDESAACSPAQARALSGALPARLRNATWRLRYSTKRDGTSLRTMYRAAGSARVRAVGARRGTSRASFGPDPEGGRDGRKKKPSALDRAPRAGNFRVAPETAPRRAIASRAGRARTSASRRVGRRTVRPRDARVRARACVTRGAPRRRATTLDRKTRRSRRPTGRHRTDCSGDRWSDECGRAQSELPFIAKSSV